ncbi:uncharacterized protein LOC126674552 [Mercurialis annua]|uniref:uncharacterized protein LOC126674552 n=1 Tax=Mercurialis annua TaxID=3986 RepID=UPI00215FEB77|nr:uncharacterized protein LOC126674552 [Mercurialis annua]
MAIKKASILKSSKRQRGNPRSGRSAPEINSLSRVMRSIEFRQEVIVNSNNLVVIEEKKTDEVIILDNSNLTKNDAMVDLNYLRYLRGRLVQFFGKTFRFFSFSKSLS